MKVTLKPITETHKSRIAEKPLSSVEKALVCDEGYPYFMVHADFIYNACADRAIYDELMAGEEVEVELIIRRVEE